MRRARQLSGLVTVEADTLRRASVRASHQLQVGTMVCVHDKGMKEPWVLGPPSTANRSQDIGQSVWRELDDGRVRDTKDLRFGLGMSGVRLSSC